MTPVPAKIWNRWRTGHLVGEAKHALVVRIRPGYIKRDYMTRFRLDEPTVLVEPAHIYAGMNVNCWQGEWTPTGPWTTLPNVQSEKHTRSFDQKGSSSCTVVMDNVAFPEVEGVGGLYHTIKRGYYAPTRGVSVPSRAALWDDTGWGNVLNGGYQIEVWEGYGTGDEVVPLAEPDPETHSCQPPGAAISRTWTGLIEVDDLESHPDHITITARDYGLLFTDQRLQGTNKAKEIRAPVTFGDRSKTMGEKPDVEWIAASSGGYFISALPSTWLSTDLGTGSLGSWLSDPHDVSESHEWVEVGVVQPRYFEKFYFAPLVSDNRDAPLFEMWLSVYVGDHGGMMDDDIALPVGWLDLGTGVSSTPDGIPAIRHWKNLYPAPHFWSLGHGFQLPRSSKFRLTLHRLVGNELSLDSWTWFQWNRGWTPDRSKYYAGGKFTFYPLDFEYVTYEPDDVGDTGIPGPPVTPSDSSPPIPIGNTGSGVNAYHWVLVNDASEVVRTLCVWAGFKEWNIEPFGWSLNWPVQFGEDKFFADVIDTMLHQGNYVFFMGPPTNDDRSIGVPHFEHQSATDTPLAMVEVRDVNLLEAAQMKWDLSNLPGVLRYRGAPSGEDQVWEESLISTYMATYFPPWSGDDYVQLGETSDWHPIGVTPFRTAGVMRHFTQSLGVGQDGQGQILNSNTECLFACLLAAVQYALAMCTGQVQVPGLPVFELNQQISVADEGSGINSRLWVASIESTHTLGPQGKWTMVISGSYIDTEDMQHIVADFGIGYELLLTVRPPSDEVTPFVYNPPPTYLLTSG